MPEIVKSNGSTHAVGQGNSVTRVFHGPWANRLATAEALLGAPHPSIPWCWCHSVQCDPFPEADPKAFEQDGEIVYCDCKMTAEYSTDFGLAQHWPREIPKPAIRDDTTIQIEAENTMEILRIPARSVAWEDNPMGYPTSQVPDADSPAGRLFVSKTEYTLTWDYLRDPPIRRLDAMQGAVNDDLFLGKEKETVLFTGYNLAASARASIVDPGAWRVTLKFSRRATRDAGAVYGWNHEYRTGGWERVVMMPGNTPRYPILDFDQLFA